MDASSYGRMVERGGYATGGVVQSTGFTLFGDGTPETRFASPAAGLVSRLDTSITASLLDAGFTPAVLWAVQDETLGWLSYYGNPKPDDGTAGVPARV